MNGTIEIVSWNVNGIRAVAGKDGFSWLHKRSPDIVCLQEIKASAEQIPGNSLFPDSYSSITVNSAERKGYSGTMTVSSVDPGYVGMCPDIDLDKEGRIIEQHFNNIALFNVYFPNGQKDDERLQYKLKFYDGFLDYCESLRAAGKSVIVCGDVNTAHKPIDLANPKANEKYSGFLPVERAWIDRFLEHGYIDTFRHIHGDIENEYSWWSYRFNARAKNVGWRIDYFFISEDLLGNLKDAFILQDITGSDHCPVGVTMQF